jgi:hypothetical protein
VAKEIVIFDIDGTLSDVSERVHHLRKRPKNWKAFFRGWLRIRPFILSCAYVTSCTNRESALSCAPGGPSSIGTKPFSGLPGKE